MKRIQLFFKSVMLNLKICLSGNEKNIGTLSCFVGSVDESINDVFIMRKLKDDTEEEKNCRETIQKESEYKKAFQDEIKKLADNPKNDKLNEREWFVVLSAELNYLPTKLNIEDDSYLFRTYALLNLRCHNDNTVTQEEKQLNDKEVTRFLFEFLFNLGKFKDGVFAKLYFEYQIRCYIQFLMEEKNRLKVLAQEYKINQE